MSGRYRLAPIVAFLASVQYNAARWEDLATIRVSSPGGAIRSAISLSVLIQLKIIISLNLDTDAMKVILGLSWSSGLPRAHVIARGSHRVTPVAGAAPGVEPSASHLPRDDRSWQAYKRVSRSQTAANAAHIASHT